MILDVGCGFDPHGDVNVDLSKTTGCNVIADIHRLKKGFSPSPSAQKF